MLFHLHSFRESLSAVIIILAKVIQGNLEMLGLEFLKDLNTVLHQIILEADVSTG